jgi:hypothetical protein
MKIFNFLRLAGEPFKYIYIRVTYKPMVINEGRYTQKDMKELWNAWRCFTDEELIEDIIKNY